MEQAESEIVVPASPEEAWESLTDPEQLESWLGEEAEIELEPGGDLAITVDEERRTGFVEEVDEPRRLVFWWAEPDHESSRVEIELEPEVEGTRVRVVESRPLSALDTGEALGGAAAPELRALAVA